MDLSQMILVLVQGAERSIALTTLDPGDCITRLSKFVPALQAFRTGLGHLAGLFLAGCG